MLYTLPAWAALFCILKFLFRQDTKTALVNTSDSFIVTMLAFCVLSCISSYGAFNIEVLIILLPLCSSGVLFVFSRFYKQHSFSSSLVKAVSLYISIFLIFTPLLALITGANFTSEIIYEIAFMLGAGIFFVISRYYRKHYFAYSFGLMLIISSPFWFFLGAGADTGGRGSGGVAVLVVWVFGLIQIGIGLLALLTGFIIRKKAGIKRSQA